MKPRRPYLLRALHEWISDSGETPHVVVDASVDGVVVPRPNVKNRKIVLNLSQRAPRGQHHGHHALSFDARFGGASFSVYVPVRAVLGVYSRESGQGMIFSEGDADPDPGDSPSPPPASAGDGAAPGGKSGKSGKRPKLQVVK